MCLRQVSVGASNVSPKYLKVFTHSMVSPLILSGGRSFGILFLVKHMALVFSGLRFSCHAVVHSSIVATAVLVWEMASSKVLAVMVIERSSAYSRMSASPGWGMSAIIRLNKVGLRFEPWGSPTLKILSSDFWLPINTLYVLSVRNS